MKIKILEDITICHNGIDPTKYHKGDVADITPARAERLIYIGAAKLYKQATPVVENKALKPIKIEKKVN